MDFKKVVAFHGHECPGLAMGYRVAMFAAKEMLTDSSAGKDIVAVVENSSCAVDAIQMVLGCTFGNGNFVFRDHGKQVYTFFKREQEKAVRIAVKWTPSPDSDEVAEMWTKFRDGDKSPEIVAVVNKSKQQKVKDILEAADDELFAISQPQGNCPAKNSLFSYISCPDCGEKLQESKTVVDANGVSRCLPCSKIL